MMVGEVLDINGKTIKEDCRPALEERFAEDECCSRDDSVLGGVWERR